MYPRFNKVYYFFIVIFVFTFLLLGVFIGIHQYPPKLLPKAKIEIALLVLGAISLTTFLGLFGFFLWERWTRYQEPRSQIRLKFLNSILDASASCLVIRNRLNKVIWTNNWKFFQTALNTKSGYYFNLKRVDKKIDKFKLNQTITFVSKGLSGEEKNEYRLTLIEKDLFLLTAKTEEFKISQMFLRRKPVFLVITLDKISSNLQEGDFERLEKQILMQIQIELYEDLKNYDILVFNSNPYEWMLIMKMQQLNLFQSKNFDFLTIIENKIKEKYKILITFSVGCYLGYQKIFRDRATLKFFQTSLINLYQKTLLARRMAQVRGGDQIILTDATSAFTVYGKQRDLPKVDTSNIKNFLQKFLLIVKKYDNIIIVGHKQADFDVIGAGVGLSYFLEKRLRTKTITFTVNKISEKTLAFVKTQTSSVIFQKYVNLTPTKVFARAKKKKTLLIVVDTNNPDFIDFPDAKVPNLDKIIIDHHINCFKEEPVLHLISSSFSSASEIVLSLMIQANISRTKPYRFNHDPDVLRLLLFGILIDTNNLQAQIGKYTLEVVNFIIQNGIKLEEMIAEINRFKTDSSRAIDLSSTEFQIQRVGKNKVVLVFNNDFLVNTELVANLAEKYLVNNNVGMVFAIGHDQNGVIYLSGRSQSPYNVEIICKHFNGGGDSRRAAAKIDDLDTKLGVIAQKLIELVGNQK